MNWKAKLRERLRPIVPQALLAFLDHHGQLALNLVVCYGIAHWVVNYTWQAWYSGRFDFVEWAFLFHNIVMLTLILVRKPPKAVDASFFNQTIAMAAFFSGLAFRDRVTELPALLWAAKAVISVAMVFGTISLFNLGRSFGILIAERDIKTGGLYRLVRHPMYLSDIIWKVGMLLKKPCAFNVAVFLFSVGCYVYRAILEERFLLQSPAYRAYAERVRYRFLPGIF